MAIIKDFTDKNGNEYKSAYWRIKDDGLRGGKSGICVHIEVKKSKGDKSTVGLLTLHFMPDANGVNYHKQAYNHAMSLDFFSDGIEG